MLSGVTRPRCVVRALTYRCEIFQHRTVAPDSLYGRRSRGELWINSTPGSDTAFAHANSDCWWSDVVVKAVCFQDKLFLVLCVTTATRSHDYAGLITTGDGGNGFVMDGSLGWGLGVGVAGYYQRPSPFNLVENPWAVPQLESFVGLSSVRVSVQVTTEQRRSGFPRAIWDVREASKCRKERYTYDLSNDDNNQHAYMCVYIYIYMYIHICVYIHIYI